MESRPRKLRADIISNLHADLLDNILSRLPLRDAVRTCTLSKQWRYKWQTIPELVFDFQLERTFPLDIERVLLHHKGPLKKFVLKVPVQFRCSDIDCWILHLSRSTVDDFTLHISSLGHRYRMTSHFFAFQHLRHLDLCGCEFKPPPEFEGLGRLVKIVFHNVDFVAPIFGKFISRCLMLETLNLAGCTECDSLEIEGQSLRFFEFHGFAKSIRFKNCPLLFSVQLCTPRLVDHNFWPCYCIKLFKFLPKPKDLHLYTRLLEFSNAGDAPNQFPCLRGICLTMSLTSTEEVACALRFIKRSPNLVILRIDLHGNRTVGAVIRFILAQPEAADSNLSKLKRVELRSFLGTECTSHMVLARYFLVSATGLERLVIGPAYSSAFRDSVRGWMDLLLLVPTASPSARIFLSWMK